MFRTQNNVPEIYVNTSRDFQLLCRLKDAVFGGVKYTIDSLQHTANSMEINTALLPLLKSKVGFFDDENLSDDQLRILLNSFPSIIKYKGSKRAIQEAICAWFRIEKIQGQITNILIDNENYKIYLDLYAREANTSLLDALFKYILPTAYEVEYRFGTPQEFNTNIVFKDNLQIVTVSNKVNSRIQKGEYGHDIENRLIGSIGLTEIATKSDLDPNSTDSDSDDPQIYPTLTEGGNS